MRLELSAAANVAGERGAGALDAAVKRLTERGSLRFQTGAGTGADALLLVQSPGRAWSVEQIEAARRYLRAGKGVVAVGVATQDGADPAQCQQLLGATGRHPSTTEAIPITSVDPWHPVLLGQGRYWSCRAQAAPVVQSATNDRILAAGRDGPVVWARESEKGRLVVLHFVPTAATLSNEPFITLLHNSLRWVGGLCEVEHNTITSAEGRAGYELLFDGRTTNGWSKDVGYWQVEDGELHGRTSGPGGGAEISRPSPLPDFVLKLGFRVDAGQASLGLDGWRVPLEAPPMPDGAEAIRYPLWHELTLRKTGGRVTLAIDGLPCPAAGSAPLQPGRISLRIEGGADCGLSVRDVRIRPQPGPREVSITGYSN